MSNEEFNELIRIRTLDFAFRIIKFLETVPSNAVTRVLIYQVCKSGTSICANFIAFCRGRSKNEKFSKICIVVVEADETDYWLTIFSLKGYGDRNELDWLSKEALELLKITASTFITLEIDNLEE